MPSQVQSPRAMMVMTHSKTVLAHPPGACARNRSGRTPTSIPATCLCSAQRSNPRPSSGSTPGALAPWPPGNTLGCDISHPRPLGNGTGRCVHALLEAAAGS
eukprot:36591-Prorocentrum_minimum.AAC.2